MILEELLEKYDVPYPSWSEVGDGWVPLIERLIVRLIELGWDKECLQIKEKFGGLRFYINGAPEETYGAIHDAINEAEVESMRTCEECGAPGKRRGGGWIKTLCDVHARR